MDEAGFEATLAVARCGSGVNQMPHVLMRAAILDLTMKGCGVTTLHHSPSRAIRNVSYLPSALARRRTPGASQAAAELARWRRLLTAAVCLTVPVFVIARVLPHFSGVASSLNVMIFGFPIDELLKWLLTTPIQVSVPHMRNRVRNSIAGTPAP